MRKREAGQAFILVLILLAIGALLVVPALRLSYTHLRSSQIVAQKTRSLYAASAAQQWILWNLKQPAFADNFTVGVPKNYGLDVCGTSVNITIVMRAVEGTGGITLAMDDVIKPTKEVTPSYVEERREEPYTYTIILDHLSDNTSVKLDAIYDLPPDDFGSGAYDEEYGSWLSLDGGDSWLRIPDPEWNAAKGYLKWPADYEWDPVVTGAFSSHPEFLGIEDFEVREVRKLRFKMRGTLGDNQVHCNWIVLKMEDGTNTLSGPQAPITVGSPDNPGECTDSRVIEVTKVSDPSIIPPGEPTKIAYTVNMTNMYTQTRHIREIRDYLPSGFYYCDNITFLDKPCPVPSGITTEAPIVVEEMVNGVLRQRLQWTTAQFPQDIDVTIASEETLALTFWAETTTDVSGSYYNEVLVILKETDVRFAEIGVSGEEYARNYSWNTGTVLVPAYDSEAEADGTIINANMSLVEGGVIISSWHIR